MFLLSNYSPHRFIQMISRLRFFQSELREHMYRTGKSVSVVHIRSLKNLTAPVQLL